MIWNSPNRDRIQIEREFQKYIKWNLNWKLSGHPSARIAEIGRNWGIAPSTSIRCGYVKSSHFTRNLIASTHCPQWLHTLNQHDQFPFLCIWTCSFLLVQIFWHLNWMCRVCEFAFFSYFFLYCRLLDYFHSCFAASNINHIHTNCVHIKKKRS